jgi:hypothetical protein
MTMTMTTMMRMTMTIVIGFNQKKLAARTTFVSLDISKAFDAIDHVLLLEKISQTDLIPNITR